ncbi:MAG: carboxypeptidase regulatory-like domain-containing protein, partial [Bacteroidales bacterium]|nr:carboxypeptidase regulatory-like domain-containing protein [Bacteroidales bacterium]
MKRIYLKRLYVLFLFELFFLIHASPQDFTQTIRGIVVDVVIKTPIPGANIIVLDTDPVIGTTTDRDGLFRIENVPVGRVSIKVSFIGYKPAFIRNAILKSGKELFLDLKLEENIEELEEVMVKAFARKDRPINEMAFVSARSFTIEETERYAGALGDPSRMAQNFAGVISAGDQRNDIVIRGNAPTGLLWRLDGINIPNPNHFSAMGSTGGPISMLNNNLLTNSDFYTGAFPAEFGNALSGVFDLNMRNGNNEKREYVGQIGFNGFEFGAEGPFSKTYLGSYLVNYRYSTLSVMNAIGFKVAEGA